MIELPISPEAFLTDYWQKKPLLIRNGLPGFISPITAEELAGLSLEEEVESRIVIQHSEKAYELKKGPFTESVYQTLPEQNWTLLVQGMDRLIPEVGDLLSQFDFIPRWRIDDIMISYAATGGNVGPHFDHYDVFLLQAQGQRHWHLTAQDCHEDNYIQGVDLRLMKTFKVEEDYVCQAGDILYIPPKWGHHGISLSDDCLTFSIGYRSYKGLELWDSLGDYLAETQSFQQIYQDPNWKNTRPGEISPAACEQAQALLTEAINNPQIIHHWFGRFATQLDTQAAKELPLPLEEDEKPSLEQLKEHLSSTNFWQRDPVCRFAYYDQNGIFSFYINGSEWQQMGADESLIQLICNHDAFPLSELGPYLEKEENLKLLLDLWQCQFFSLS